MAKRVEEQAYDAKPDFQGPFLFRRRIALLDFRRWKRCAQAKKYDNSRNQRNELVYAGPVILLPDQQDSYPGTHNSGDTE